MNEITIQKAAVQFGQGEPAISLLGEGLIHRTYKVNFSSGTAIVLQCINQHTFKQPENIINNYRLLLDYLLEHNTISIPDLLSTRQGKWYWIDQEGNFWRATGFINNSYARSHPANNDEVFITAKCFAVFTRSLEGLDIQKLEIIIPGFHDLTLRYKQFQQAIVNANQKRLAKADNLVIQLQQRHKLVDFYNSIIDHPDYKVRVMHHDCKMSNILFDAITQQPICPVDLDTVMPGLFFSDIGDMIRSMAGTVDENNVAFDAIDIRKDYYKAIINGYLEGMGLALTEPEHTNIHHAGLLMIYMQALRFMGDYLNNDIYYKTHYAEQNYDRALNQFILLERLEQFLAKEYGYTA